MGAAILLPAALLRLHANTMPCFMFSSKALLYVGEIERLGVSAVNREALP